MAERYLHRYEYDKPRMFPCHAGSVIERGDLLWQNAVGEVANANSFPWDTNLETTRRQFQRAFAGVARMSSAAGETDDIRVGLVSVFEMDCAAQTWDTLDWVAPAADATGILLEDQVVGPCNRKTGMIGFVAARRAAAATTVLIDLYQPFCCQSTTTTTSTTSTSTTTTTTTTVTTTGA